MARLFRWLSRNGGQIGSLVSAAIRYSKESIANVAVPAAVKFFYSFVLPIALLLLWLSICTRVCNRLVYCIISIAIGGSVFAWGVNRAAEEIRSGGFSRSTTLAARQPKCHDELSIANCASNQTRSTRIGGISDVPRPLALQKGPNSVQNKHLSFVGTPVLPESSEFFAGDITRHFDDLYPLSVTICCPLIYDCPLLIHTKGFREMTGFTAEEITFKNCRFLNRGCHMDPHVRNQLKAICAPEHNRFSKKAVQSFDATVQNRRKDGTRFHTHLWMQRITVEAVPFVVGVQMDCKALQQQPLHQQQLFGRLMDVVQRAGFSEYIRASLATLYYQLTGQLNYESFTVPALVNRIDEILGRNDNGPSARSNCVNSSSSSLSSSILKSQQQRLLRPSSNVLQGCRTYRYGNSYANDGSRTYAESHKSQTPSYKDRGRYSNGSYGGNSTSSAPSCFDANSEEFVQRLSVLEQQFENDKKSQPECIRARYKYATDSTTTHSTTHSTTKCY